MTRRAACLILLLAVGPAFPQSSSDTFEDVRRIVAFGDVHGDYQRFQDLLRTAGLVDGKGAWSGGAAHLVLNGDFVDRGDHSAQVMDLVMELEQQAKKAGGRVHALLGNHEAMNLYGDLRYVTKDDFEGFASANKGGAGSKDLRDRHMNASLEELKRQGMPPGDEAAWRRKFLDEHPLGWVEHQLAFQPNGKYGKWLRQQNAIVRINDAIFLHGGIGPKFVARTRREINSKVREELSDFTKIAGGMVTDEEGPLWYRGLAQSPEDDPAMVDLVSKVLATHQVRHIVIGHTPQVAVIPRFGGKVIAIDVGLSQSMGGPPAFIVIEDGKYFAVHRGRRLELPGEGGNVLEYLGSAAALEPADSRLRRAIQNRRP